MVEIEDGIEIPASKGGAKKYPFDELGVGQSFVISAKGGSTVQTARKKWPNRGFITRTVPEGIRVWRIA